MKRRYGRRLHDKPRKNIPYNHRPESGEKKYNQGYNSCPEYTEVEIFGHTPANAQKNAFSGPVQAVSTDHTVKPGGNM
jgi:hypothetical protein